TGLLTIGIPGSEHSILDWTPRKSPRVIATLRFAQCMGRRRRTVSYWRVALFKWQRLKTQAADTHAGAQLGTVAWKNCDEYEATAMLTLAYPWPLALTMLPLLLHCLLPAYRQTKPADFMRAKFAYQLSHREQGTIAMIGQLVLYTVYLVVLTTIV